ncbi:hypothetical protein TMatcc_004960 [Talaromyces marneffei ATCC 18224]
MVVINGFAIVSLCSQECKFKDVSVSYITSPYCFAGIQPVRVAIMGKHLVGDWTSLAASSGGNGICVSVVQSCSARYRAVRANVKRQCGIRGSPRSAEVVY